MVILLMTSSVSAEEVTYNPLQPPQPAPLQTYLPTVQVTFGGTYGPTDIQDNVKNIAKTMMGDRTDVTLPQVMMAIVMKNQTAFENGNPQLLKSNMILQLPTVLEIRTFFTREDVKNLENQLKNTQEKLTQLEEENQTLLKNQKIEVVVVPATAPAPVSIPEPTSTTVPKPSAVNLLTEENPIPDPVIKPVPTPPPAPVPVPITPPVIIPVPAQTTGSTGLIVGIGGGLVVVLGLIAYRRRQTKEEVSSPTMSEKEKKEEALDSDLDLSMPKFVPKNKTMPKAKPISESKPEPIPKPKPESTPIPTPIPTPVPESTIEPTPDIKPEPKSELKPDEDAPIHFELDKKPEPPTPKENVVLPIEELPLNHHQTQDNAEAQLDLAKQYLTLNDREGARSILTNILKIGSPTQKALAMKMLDDLA